MTSTPTPTQVRRPWRSTIRTVVQAAVALAVMAPVLVQTAGLDPASLPWLAGVLAVCAAVARVSVLPEVEQFLRRFGILRWLAAEPPPKVYIDRSDEQEPPGQHRLE